MKKELQLSVGFELPVGVTADMTIQELFEYAFNNAVSSSSLKNEKRSEAYFKFPSGETLEINYERKER